MATLGPPPAAPGAAEVSGSAVFVDGVRFLVQSAPVETAGLWLSGTAGRWDWLYLLVPTPSRPIDLEIPVWVHYVDGGLDPEVMRFRTTTTVNAAGVTTRIPITRNSDLAGIGFAAQSRIAVLAATFVGSPPAFSVPEGGNMVECLSEERQGAR